MKSFNRLLAIIIIILGCIFVGFNVFFFNQFANENGRLYMVEINRLRNEISQVGIENISLNGYTYVKKITALKSGADSQDFFEGTNRDYIIRKINGVYYRFDYEINLASEYKDIRRSVNIVMAIMSAAVLGVMLFVRTKLMKPFNIIREVPYELSKGNLTVGLKEGKNRFFGRFVWGLDLLREKLEEQRTRELAMQKEKKTLVLSISHDIKTPLSAIKLYAKALSRNLYDGEEKRIEIADKISEKADEIEGFVAEIIKASSGDFLNLKVQNSEFYLNDLMDKINAYYSEKLSLLKIEFSAGRYENCLIKGDIDRAVEVIQNIMENAVKYGDGMDISISLTSEEDCRLVTVSNSGCTLTDNELPHIFDSFWRGSNVANKSGSGLGLYICRQLMQKMDGEIFAECRENEMKVTAVFRMV